MMAKTFSGGRGTAIFVGTAVIMAVLGTVLLQGPAPPTAIAIGQRMLLRKEDGSSINNYSRGLEVSSGDDELGTSPPSNTVSTSLSGSLSSDGIQDAMIYDLDTPEPTSSPTSGSSESATHSGTHSGTHTSSTSSSLSSSFSGSFIEGVVWDDDWGTWHDDYYTLNEDEEINEVQIFNVFEPIDLTCELIQNLGYGFSEATWGHPNEIYITQEWTGETFTTAVSDSSVEYPGKLVGLYQEQFDLRRKLQQKRKLILDEDERNDNLKMVTEVIPGLLHEEYMEGNYNTEDINEYHFNHMETCFPPVREGNFDEWVQNPDVDDSVAVFVGGNFISENAAEVEGKVVVLGNLQVTKYGATNWVSVGLGSHVLPSIGSECIVVGGDLIAHADLPKNIQVYNQHDGMFCDIVYKGEAPNKHVWKTNGFVDQIPGLDLSMYEMMMGMWKDKSHYWASLEPTGKVIHEDWGNPEGQTTYECSENNEIQVFTIEKDEWEMKLEKIHTIYFGEQCVGKTILINLLGEGNLAFDAAAMLLRTGPGPEDFEHLTQHTCMISSILWNIPDASFIDIGNGRTSEFIGSLLVANEDSETYLTTSGQSGRTIVLGDLIHKGWKEGSEFHSFDFNPPTPLPDPGCDGSGSKVPTTERTEPPVAAPVAQEPSSPSPTCVLKEEMSVCIALDNSGSICTSPGLDPKLCDNCSPTNQCRAGDRASNEALCCGNYATLTNFAQHYIEELPSVASFSVVKFGTTASVVTGKGTSAFDAKEAIVDSAYTGGYTNTQDAIQHCVDMLKGEPNPIIALVTDGTPTACQTENGNTVHIGKQGCSRNNCPACPGGNAQEAAAIAADIAAIENMSLIPVVITTVDSNVDQLEALARCPVDSDTCDVNAYKGLNVKSLYDLELLIDDLVASTGCEEPPIPAPVVPPTELPTTPKPTTPITEPPVFESNTEPPVTPPEIITDCLGEVINSTQMTDINIFESMVTTNTLHIDGGELRYERVGFVRDMQVDLLVTITGGDYTDIAQTNGWVAEQKNGKVGESEFGNINLQTKRGKPESGLGKFKFCFVENGGYDEVTVDNFRWSVFDFDERGDDKKQKSIGIKEKMIMDISQAKIMQLWPDVAGSEVKLSCEDGTSVPCGPGVRTVFHSSTDGNAKDNPTNPNKMSDRQKKRSVTFTFKDTACWEFSYDHYCPAEQPDSVYPHYEGGFTDSECRWYGGGNFLFSGDAEEMITQGECVTPPPTPEPVPTSEPTKKPVAPTEYPTMMVEVGTPPPTFLLPDCYDGPKLVEKDSSDRDMCLYYDEMVDIKSFNGENVTLGITNVWPPYPIPTQTRVFVHMDGVDALSGGFQCPEGQEEGMEVTVDPDYSFNVQCHQKDPGDPFLAVIDVVITDPIICGSNTVDNHPCRPGDPILESCQWRIIIPCEVEAMCTEPPVFAPVAETATERPTYLLPDCYEGGKLVESDSSDVTMCDYKEEMVEILSFNTESDESLPSVSVAINDVWKPFPAPEETRVYIHTDGVNALSQLGGGFQCLDVEGFPIDLDEENTLDVPCYRKGGDRDGPLLAVIDVVITSPIICGSNAVDIHPCGPDWDPILESCQWRIVLPCEEEEMCTEEPAPTPSPVADVVTEPPIITNGETPSPNSIEPPGPECPEDILVISQTGFTDFPMNDAVQIVSQDAATVTVDVNQAWGDKVDYVYLYYRESMFNHHCFNHSNVEEGFFDEITITCNIFSPKAFVEICVADKENEVLTEGDDGEVPDCCKPPPPDGSNVVCYNLEINCVSECVDEAQERKRTLLQQAGGWFFDGEQ